MIQTRSSAISRLQKAMYVYNMARGKKRTRRQTIIRLERQMVDAARELVREHDAIENERYMLMTSPAYKNNWYVRNHFTMFPEEFDLAVLKRIIAP